MTGRASERGAVLVWFALLLPVLLAFAAFVVDVGQAFMLKRHLQASADAAALAAAQDLPNSGTADTVAHDYSAEAAGKNERENLPNVTTTVEFPAPQYQKVRVIQEATSPAIFGGILGFDGFDVEARALASRGVTTVTEPGTPYAVWVNELCGAPTGDKGLQANGKNMHIQGAIHVNGQFKIGDSGFKSDSVTTVYRPPHADSPSPPGPTQGTCNGTAPLRIENLSDARYCVIDCAPGLTEPKYGPHKPWITDYHTEADVKTRLGTCTHGPGTANPTSGDVKIDAGTVISSPRFYCLGETTKFTMEGNVTGPAGTHARITVIAGYIEVTGAGSKISPYATDSNTPLFYSTNTASTPLKVNPSGALDWKGYVINRRGGIEINSGNVVSPREGLLEAAWIVVNGENFKMLGKGPDSPGTTTTTVSGDVGLDE
jgi:hypothetical protein